MNIEKYGFNKLYMTLTDDTLNLLGTNCYGDDFVFLTISEIKFEKKKVHLVISYSQNRFLRIVLKIGVFLEYILIILSCFHLFFKSYFKK